MKRILLSLGFAVLGTFAVVCSASGLQSNQPLENEKSSVYPPIFIVVNNMPYTEEQLQKYAPQGYDCGYVMKDPYGSFLYGIFLVKKDGKYNLVYKNAGKIMTKSIQQQLADKLETSAKTILKNASVPYTKTDNNDDEVIWVEIYDGFYAYALIPDKIAECQTGEFTDIPDKIWMDEVVKFKQAENDPKANNDILIEKIDTNEKENNPGIIQGQDGVYILVPEGPEYPEGSSALFEFIKNTMIYPAAAVKDSIQGRVIVQFIVEEDGSITNPVVVKSSGQNRDQAYSSIFNQLDAEAIRIISVMPKWNPGKVEGKPCRVRFNLPINFRLN